jgi:hypothetical protein
MESTAASDPDSYFVLDLRHVDWIIACDERTLGSVIPWIVPASG